MDVITKITKESERVSEIVKFDITYIPGETIEEDLYYAKLDSLNIFIYGATEIDAIKGARKELVARMIEDTKLREDIVRHYKRSL